jgi:Cu(I)/Ag(I) efflux system periplasmic protein CusF
MKLITTLSLILVLSVSSLAIAQSDGMKDAELGKKIQGKAHKVLSHKTTGVVKAVNSSKGTVTLAHGRVESLNWPAMTMSFVVKDKRHFDNLTVGKKVKVEFIKQDTDYIVTSVK